MLRVEPHWHVRICDTELYPRWPNSCQCIRPKPQLDVRSLSPSPNVLSISPPSVGIVVIGVIALFVSFCGHAVLNWYERIAWFPVVLTFVIVLGLGGPHLGEATFKPATAQAVLSYASTLAGFTIAWTPLGADYTIYYREDVKR